MQNTPNVETSATPSVVEHDDYMNGSLNSLWAKICEPKEIPQPEKNPEPEENVESEKTHEPPPNAGIGSRIIASDYDPPKTSTSYPQQLASADIHQSYPVVSNGPLHFPPSLVPSNPAYSEGQIDEWLENNPVWNSIGYTARTSVGRSTSRAVDESGGNPIGYTALDRSTNRTVDAHRHEGIIQQVDQLLRTAEGIRVEDKPADGDAPACCDICDATFGGRYVSLLPHKFPMRFLTQTSDSKEAISKGIKRVCIMPLCPAVVSVLKHIGERMPCASMNGKSIDYRSQGPLKDEKKLLECSCSTRMPSFLNAKFS